MRPGEPRSLVVVGGGVAGLAAAWFAADAGFDVTVLEGSPRVGGKLLAGEVGGVTVDLGAESMLATRPEGTALIDSLGLTDRRVTPLTTSARIRAGGALHALPARTVLGVPGDLDAVRASGVLSEVGVQRAAAEAELPPLPPLVGDVAVGPLVRERLGDEVADRLVEPLLGGVYAGRSDELSLRATMPALAGRLAEGGWLGAAATSLAAAGGTRPPGQSVFTSLRGGIAGLPSALAASGRFRVRTGVTVRAIARTAAGFALDCGAVPAAEQIAAGAVIVAVPAAKASRLLRPLAPRAASALAEITSASMAIVTFAFRGVQLPEGSGLLVAAGERLATKAVTVTSQKWSLPGELTLLRASVGRAGEAQALQFDDADLTELVRRELQPLLGLDAAPVDSLVTRWGGGLPQYGVGHLERVARVRAAVARVPGLAVCGAAYDGVGIPACIGSARAAVDRLSSTEDTRTHG